MKQSVECPICMSEPSETVTTSCNHIFCEECARRWGRHHNTCPLCRGPIAEEMIVDRMSNIILLVLTFAIVFFMIGIFEHDFDTKFTEHKEVDFTMFFSVIILRLILMCLSHHFETYQDDVVSRMRAQECGVTVQRLEWIYKLFTCTGLAICLVPSLNMWWGAAAGLGVVLLLPSAWEVSIALIVFAVSVSYTLPSMLDFIANFIATRVFPDLGELNRLPCAPSPHFLARILVVAVLFTAASAVQKRLALTARSHS